MMPRWSCWVNWVSGCCRNVNVPLNSVCLYQYELLMNGWIWTGVVCERRERKMSRPMLLVFLLLILIITSQFEWREQIKGDAELSPNVSLKQQQISKREEAVKEKVMHIISFRSLVSYGASWICCLAIFWFSVCYSLVTSSFVWQWHHQEVDWFVLEL